jgi:hypothetical protein
MSVNIAVNEMEKRLLLRSLRNTQNGAILADARALLHHCHNKPPAKLWAISKLSEAFMEAVSKADDLLRPISIGRKRSGLRDTRTHEEKLGWRLFKSRQLGAMLRAHRADVDNKRARLSEAITKAKLVFVIGVAHFLWLKLTSIQPGEGEREGESDGKSERERHF